MPGPRAPWFLEQEARALLTRLDRVKPFSLLETSVPAAALAPAALIAIERYLIAGRKTLRDRVRTYVRWLRGPGASASPVDMQRRFTTLRLGFNASLSQLDLFAEAISQRSEHELGVWLAGLDVAAQDALGLPDRFYDAPPIVCYLHRGLGGAIRRARTRLPGGGENPVAVIRIPRERMIGYGIASSLVHEVGHQAAALLKLVESLRLDIARARAAAPEPDKLAWKLYGSWISEIVADYWSICKVGISSTLGLIGIVSLPRRFVFRINVDDPHPFPWIRTVLSCAIGDALYPHPQWANLARVWESFYPVTGLDPRQREIIDSLRRTMPAFVQLLAGHRPATLYGYALGEVVPSAERAPANLLRLFAAWSAKPSLMREAPPTLVFAAFGQARASGKLTPEQEDRQLGVLITHWALRSTLDMAEICARTPKAKAVPPLPALTLGREPALTA